jgi:hypothetical protein
VRKIALLICLLALPSVSLAQSKQALWANLSTLHSGQKIQVVGTDSKKHSGTFLSFTDTSISFHDASGDQTIQKLNISNVKLMENHHRLRNTAIGAGIGAGVGAGIGAASYKPCPPGGAFCIDPVGRGGEAAIIAVVGFLGGAAVGALIPTHSTIYNVNSH